MKTFFLEDTMIFGQKLRNLKMIQTKDFFFYLRSRILYNFLAVKNHDSVIIISNTKKINHDFRKVLENHDSGKCDEIRAKLHNPFNFFGWYCYGYVYYLIICHLYARNR